MNPDVLLLAYNMYISMQTPVANGFNFISSNFNSTMATGVIQMPKQEDKVNITIIHLSLIFITKCQIIYNSDEIQSRFSGRIKMLIPSSSKS